MNDLCFATISYGQKYQAYLPLYIYSAQRAYPGSSVKVFVDELLPEVLADIKILRLMDKGEIEIDTTFLNEVKYLEGFKGTGSCGSCMVSARWIIPPEKLPGKYVLITDADIFFLPEQPDLKRFHIERMERVGLPFSNVIRKGQRRMTGIHFFEKEPYYFYLKRILRNMNKAKAERYQAGTATDEGFLYNIVEHCFEGKGFPGALIKETERPWHGLHLGIWRKGDFNEDAFNAHSTATLDEAGAYMLECFHDPYFQQLKTTPLNKEFNFMCDYMGVKGWLR